MQDKRYSYGAEKDVNCAVFQPIYGQGIVVLNWVGLEETIRLVRLHREELMRYFNRHFVDRTFLLEHYVNAEEGNAVATKSGASLICDVHEGGIFATLWTLSRKISVGLDLEYHKLPIRQETVEVTEYFGINPYELRSSGCLVIVTKEPSRLVNDCKARKIPAVWVGTVTKEKAKILRHGDELRYLNKYKPTSVQFVRDTKSLT
ncbi:MAG: hypothetical protein LBM69_09720 [Lachnospiraceae bacterium]|jgi:hydrogenase maturation factor|nr:hypothetical protein [Lachnospiraceae bacterium]